MKQGFSLGMDVTINKDGLYDANISYLDTEDNEIKASTQGKNIEEVCWNLYKDLEEQVLAIEEKEQTEDLSDKDYIAYLEDYVAELKAENATLRQSTKEKSKKKNTYEEDLIKQIDKIFDKYDFKDPFKLIGYRKA